ncbi:hypothetical protein [Sunxiuqinia sp. sy24]|uniref:hypothetical protein n=1 Tax=Sunxiuqinia sp. sy24 TaxID=3461495 RepID=UPI0040451C08
MEIYVNSKYGFELFMLSVLLAAAFSFILYRKSKQNSPLSSQQIYGLSALRFLSVFLLSSLFLQLAVQHLKHRQYKPRLIIGIDNSESLRPFQNDLVSVINQLKSDLNSYSPEFLLFDSETAHNSAPDFTGKRSDYSNLLTEINQSYLPSDIGALLLLGDGIFNAGADPVFVSESINYPIYTIGFGDTTIHADAAIRKVTTNSTVFLDDYFAVEIDLRFTKAAGQMVKLVIEESDEILYSRAIRVQPDPYFLTENLSLKPTKEGIVRYSVRLEEVNGEQNLANNTFDFSVDVISEKQRILFLAHGPHPDIGALMNALEDKSSYEMEVITNPNDKLDFTNYDLVVVHQWPDATQRSVSFVEKLIESGRPALFILGQKTAVPGFNQLKTGLEFLQGNSFEQATPLISNQFNLFRFNPSQMRDLETFPPLLVPFGEVVLHPSLEIFANQAIQSIETERPLIAFGRIDGHKRGFIAGEGLWRWRIHNYLKNGSHRNFDQWIQKAIHYLILKRNEDNFNLFWETEYAEDEPIIIHAELFNESFELDNSADIHMEIAARSGQEFEVVFDRMNDKYQLNMGCLPVGEYKFTAHTFLGEKEYEESGNFTVNPIQIELVNTDANFKSLAQMARKTGGNFYLSQQVNELVKQLNKQESLNSKEIELQAYQELLSVKWIFFIILFLLALEWFLRKFWGIY